MPTMESASPMLAGATPYHCCNARKVNEILENCMAAKMPHCHNAMMRGQWVAWGGEGEFK